MVIYNLLVVQSGHKLGLLTGELYRLLFSWGVVLFIHSFTPAALRSPLDLPSISLSSSSSQDVGSFTHLLCCKCLIESNWDISLWSLYGHRCLQSFIITFPPTYGHLLSHVLMRTMRCDWKLRKLLRGACILTYCTLFPKVKNKLLCSCLYFWPIVFKDSSLLLF